MQDGAAKLAWINESLQAGRTVYLSNHLKSIAVTPKTILRWKAAGQELFKTDTKGSLYIRRGKAWDCIDYTALRAA